MPVISVHNNKISGPVAYVLDLEATGSAHVVFGGGANMNFNHELVVSDTKSALVKFDDSLLPVNATVTLAELRLNHYYQTTAGRMVEVDYCMTSWNPATVTANTFPSTGGAHMDNKPIDTPYGYKAWDITAYIAALCAYPSVVQYGFVIQRGPGYPYTGETNYGADNAAPGYRPILHIEYTV